jgi:HSP20 family molecular chaperone IbpA
MTTPSSSNDYFSNPVVFFSAGPTCQRFANGHHGPRQFSSTGPARRDNGRNGLLRTIPKIALLLLTVFALSMVVRFVAFVMEILFSPPVLAMCLVALFIAHNTSEDNHPTFVGVEFNVTEFQRLLRNPRRLRRYFNMNQACCGGQCHNRRQGPSGGAPTSTSNQQTSQQQQQQSTTQEHTNQQGACREPTNAAPTTANDFEIVNALNLLASAMNPSNEESPASSTHSSEFVHVMDEEETKKHLQKVPVHREENDSGLTLSMDISGFEIDNIQISVDNSKLYIRGERKNKIGDTFIIKEQFNLDEEQVVEDSITATAIDGVLEVKIAKKKPPVPRIISITTDKKDE